MSTTLRTLAGAFLASKDFDAATVARVGFWSDVLGDKPVTEVSADDVDDALQHLAQRGRLKAGRNLPATPSGRPLASSTINRHISQLGSLYRYARKHRIVPRNHVPPTRGIEKEPEYSSPDRYFRPEEVERLLAAASAIDTRWRRMRALIATAFCTGLRSGNLAALKWEAVDLKARTISVARTKNGRPVVSPLSPTACEELAKLPNKVPESYVFANSRGEPFHWQKLYLRVTEAAGLKGKNFHQLRHGCGSALAAAGRNQAIIMAVMGHRTLTASARYMHLNTADKAAAIEGVF